MAWIELHQALPNHRKTLALADVLGIAPVHALGHLTAFWLWAIDNAPDGSISKYHDSVLADAAGWTGDANVFVQALFDCKFLDGRCRIVSQPTIRHVRASMPAERAAMRRAWESISRWMRPQILERDGCQCRICGTTSGRFEIDHIIPIAKSGTNDDWNLQVLCRPCNRSKGAN